VNLSFLLLIFLTLILLFVSTLRAISHIKYKRHKGIDVRKKSTYYRVISKLFLKELP